MGEYLCPIRNERVAASPEEGVRQQLIRHMIEERGYPASLISVEKGLNQLPHLTGNLSHPVPKRRADLIVFGKGIHPQYDLYPLILAECKAVKLTAKTISQAAGYNQFVSAPFILLVNQLELKTGWFDRSTGGYVFINYLPSFKDLLNKLVF